MKLSYFNASVATAVIFLLAGLFLAPGITQVFEEPDVILGDQDNLQVLTQTANTASPQNSFDATKALVPCGVEDKNGDGMIKDIKKDGQIQVIEECGWNDLIKLVHNVANYLIILGASVATIAFAYAGFLMMTAAGETSKIERAKSIFGKVLVGFLLMLAAWLIVHAIESALVTNTEFKSLLEG